MLIQLFLRHSALNYFAVLFFLLLGRGIAYWIGLPTLDTEISWGLIGDRMAEGYSLYKDIYSSIEPFSAGVYFILSRLTGEQTTTYALLSLLVVFCQAVLLNEVLNKNKVFKESTTLPAFCYILFSGLFLDYYTLSPVVMGTTFLIAGLNYLLLISKNAEKEERFFYAGMYFGLASLFYIPFAFFILFAVVSIALYAAFTLKRMTTMVLAFFFPYLPLLLYYFWIDNLTAYYQLSLVTQFNTSPVMMTDWMTLSKVAIIPTLLLLLASFTIASKGKYLHYQYKVIKIMGLWVIFSVAAFSMVKTVAPVAYFMFLPPLAYFATHLFMLMQRNKIQRELLFWAIVGGIQTISFYALLKPDLYTKTNYLKVVPAYYVEKAIEGKKVMVFGNDNAYYLRNRGASPYIAWSLSSWQFDGLTRYQNVSTIYEAMELNTPALIVDLENRMPALIEVIPKLERLYKRDGTSVYYNRVN